MDRWRGRSTALAIVAASLVLALAAASAIARSGPTLEVSLPDGQLLARVTLPADGSFGLRYRNSLYGTLAEERFVVTDDGRIRLVSLAAEQLAVLEEYYAITQAARPATGADRLAWEARPAHVPTPDQLRVAATDRGERTLVVDGAPALALWRLVDDAAPTVVLEVAP
jgi:hypothetical protein